MSCVASSRAQVDHKSVHIESTIRIKCCINSSDICRIIIVSRIRFRNVWHLITKSRNKIWSNFTKRKQILCKIGRNNTRMRRKRCKCTLWCYNGFCTKFVDKNISTLIIIIAFGTYLIFITVRIFNFINREMNISIIAKFPTFRIFPCSYPIKFTVCASISQFIFIIVIY